MRLRSFGSLLCLPDLLYSKSGKSDDSFGSRTDRLWFWGRAAKEEGFAWLVIKPMKSKRGLFAISVPDKRALNFRKHRRIK